MPEKIKLIQPTPIGGLEVAMPTNCEYSMSTSAEVINDKRTS